MAFGLGLEDHQYRVGWTVIRAHADADYVPVDEWGSVGRAASFVVALRDDLSEEQRSRRRCKRVDVVHLEAG